MRIPPETSPLLLVLGAFLLVVGLLLTFLGLASPSEVAEAEGGGFLIIGPFPIIFYGEVGLLAGLAIFIITALIFLLLVIYSLKLMERELRDREMGEE